ncbi:MAG: sugar phosphate nucleotidyltransferase [Spirochaetota bacterium]
MKCFLLAAGFGKRMQELTQKTPKPLLQLGGFPLLEYSIHFAYRLGIREFIINTHYLGKQIKEYVKSFRNLKFHISHEEEILGTGGGIRTGIEGIIAKDETFLLLNPDILFLPNPRFSLKMPQDSSIHLFLQEKQSDNPNTALYLQENKVSFSTPSSKNSTYFYIGLSTIHAKIIFETIKYNERFELPILLRDLGKKHSLTGSVFAGDVFDVGTKSEFLTLEDKKIFPGMIANDEDWQDLQRKR